ncbi:MAG: type II secretion system GspH family protein [Chitinivibrionia bacterium]|nr:type II secretion system GspH family protein [Chitinivibrionia bacterium]
MFSFLKKNQGYSLVEVMVGMVGLSIVVLLLATVVQTSIKTSSATREGDYALAAARAKLNELTSQSNLTKPYFESQKSGQDSDEERYQTPGGGTPIRRYWKINNDDYSFADKLPPENPILVEVWVLNEKTSNKDTIVKISGYIDPSNTCKPENIKRPPTVTYDDDAKISNSNNISYDVEVQFPQGSNTIASKDVDLWLSVSPHPDDALAAHELIIDGPVRPKTQGSINGAIVINEQTFPTVSSSGSGSSLEFTIAYANCEGKINDNAKVKVQIRFVAGLGPINIGGDDFLGTIAENCTGCSEGSDKANRNENELTEKIVIDKQDANTSISVANQGTESFPFTWDENSGEFKVKAPSTTPFNGSIYFNYEDGEKVYRTTYAATRGNKDKNGNIDIKVKNINEPPTGIIMKNSYYQDDALYTTTEDFKAGLEVATIIVEDNDTNAAFLKYTFNITPSSSIFEIVDIVKNTAKVKIKSDANLEATTPPTNYSFNVEITANTDANSTLAGGNNFLSTATNGFIDANGNTVSSSNISSGISLKVDDTKCASNPHLCVGYKNPCLEIPEWKSGTTTGLVKYDKVVYYPDFHNAPDGATAPNNNIRWQKIIECEKLNDKSGTKDFKNDGSGQNQNTDRVLYNNYIYLRVGGWTSSAPTGTTIAAIDNGWLCLAKAK